jgi:hypothetical protein
MNSGKTSADIRTGSTGSHHVCTKMMSESPKRTIAMLESMVNAMISTGGSSQAVQGEASPSVVEHGLDSSNQDHESMNQWVFGCVIEIESL